MGRVEQTVDTAVLEKRAWRVTAAVGAVAAAVGAWAVVRYGGELTGQWFPVAVLVAISLLATASPPRVSWMSVVMAADTLPVVVAGVLFGPAAALVVGTVGTVILRQVAERKWRALIYNRAALGLSAVASSFVYRALYVAHLPSLSLRDAIAFVAMLVVYSTLNNGATAVYVSAGRGSRVGAEIWSVIRQEAFTVVGAAVLGPLALVSYALLGRPGLIALVVPVILVNRFLARYQAYTRAFLAAVESLATALGAKDQVTLDHSRRVGEYAAQIARQMHLSETQVGIMYYNGLMHDIGKLGICDELLKKPTVFTPAEYEQVKVHAALSEQFTAPFWRVDVAVRRMNYTSYHHERWDGRGYPRGLAGEDIPLGGRILAVADAFDAMTSDRPYHKGIRKEEAYRELIRCAGTQFDPVVVRAFLESQGVEVPPSYDQRVRAQEIMARRRRAAAAVLQPTQS